MDNPILKIKQGISEQKWELICEAYQQLTSEKIEIPLNIRSSSVTDDQAIAIVLRRWLDEYNKSENIQLLPKTSKKKPQNTVGVVVPIKKGYYGNDTIPITDNDIPKSEIKKNKEKAAITNQRKIKREAPKEYEVLCSNCEAKFKSDRPDTKDFGQKCKKCLDNLIAGKNSNDN